MSASHVSPQSRNRVKLIRVIFVRFLVSPKNFHVPLRSSNTNLLSVPRVHTTFASRGFSVAAPSVWNPLSVDIRACSSSHTFRRLLTQYPLFPAGLQFPLAAHTTDSDWASGRHCALQSILLTYLLTRYCAPFNCHYLPGCQCLALRSVREDRDLK